MTTSKSRKDPKGEKNYQSVISLPFWPRVFIVGGQSGTIYVVHNCKVKRRYNAYSLPVAALVATDQGFISTSYDGKWTFWERNEENQLLDTKTGDFKCVAGLKGFGAPRSLSYDVTSKTLLVGSRRNQLFSVNISDPEALTGQLHVHGHAGDIWGLASHPTENLFITGGYDGMVSCFDLDSNTMVGDKQLSLSKQKICCATWSDDGKFIAVGTESSRVYLIDFETFQVVQDIMIPLRNRNSEVEQVGVLVFNPESTMLACGHFDSHIYMFDLKKEEAGEVQLEMWGHNIGLTAACTHLQWSTDNRFLKSFGRDYYLQTWEVFPQKQRLRQYTHLLDPDEVKFSGNPIIAGWDVQGLLQQDMDGTDINTTSVTKGDGERLLVCGDDSGKVHLHKYPALNRDLSKNFCGHSAFVVDVKWNHNDQKVISVGGGDRAVLVWNRQSLENEI